MGDTIWLDVRWRSDEDVPRDNTIMLRLQKELDQLAAKLGVPKLSDFYDYSELEGYYDPKVLEEEAEALLDEEGVGSGAKDDLQNGGEDAAGDAGSTAEKGSWFDSARGLAAVRAIRAHLERRPEDLGFKSTPSTNHWIGYLMEELWHCETTVEAAASRGVQFRFLIVP